MGAVLNLLSIPFFLNEWNLVLASFLVYVVAVYRGAISAFIVASLSCIPLVMSSSSLLPFYIYGLEAVSVALIYKYILRNLLFSALLFWLFFGLLFYYIIADNVFLFNASEPQLMLVKYVFDAIVNISIASIIISNNFGYKVLSGKLEYQNHSLKKIIASHFSAVLLLITVVSANYLIIIEIKKSYVNMSHDMRKLEREIVSELNLKMNSRISALKEVAYGVSQVWNDSVARGDYLNQAHERLVYFNSMLIADDNGDILDYSLNISNRDVPLKEKLNVSDRKYFIEAKSSDDAYISNGLKGRGLGINNIVTISQSIHNKNDKSVLGIIQGALLFNDFSSFGDLLSKYSLAQMVLVDQSGKILYGSQSLNLKELTSFLYFTENQNFYGREAERMYLDNKPYFYNSTELSWGWRLYLLEDGGSLLATVKGFNTVFVIIVILIVVFVELFSFWLSNYLTKYLTKLSNAIKYIGFDYYSEGGICEKELPEELRMIYKSIQDSNREVKLIKKNLYSSLKLTTEQYPSATTQLKEFEFKDYLTKLDNLESFNKKLDKVWRHKTESFEALSVVVLSVNDFDEIHSIRGSIFSDNILIQISNQIRTLKRYYCCAARVGSNKITIIDKFNSHTETVDFAKKVQSCLEELQFVHAEDNVYAMIKVSISIGVVTVDPYRSNLDEFFLLIHRAISESAATGGANIKSINKSILI